MLLSSNFPTFAFMKTFTTWIEGVPLIEVDAENLPPIAAYRDAFDVPEPVRAQIRAARDAGVPPSELSRIFNMPIAWVAIFLGEPN